MRRILLILTLAALNLPSSSCFNPDYSHVVFKCSTEKPGCPANRSCVDGICVPVLDGMTMVVDAGADGGNGDLANSESGCAGQTGYELGANAYACPGLFGKGQALGRCAAGWHLCDKPAGIDLAKCNALNGFFVAEVPAHRSLSEQPKDAFCGPSADIDFPLRLFFGCGKLLSYTVDAKPPGCGGFRRVLDCVSPWDCDTGFSPHSLANSTHGVGSENDGVLCCR